MKEGSSEAGFSRSFRRRDIRKRKKEREKVISGLVGCYGERSKYEDNYADDIIKHNSIGINHMNYIHK